MTQTVTMPAMFGGAGTTGSAEGSGATAILPEATRGSVFAGRRYTVVDGREVEVHPHELFNDLVLERQQRHFLSVARRALPLWGYPDDATLKLLNLTENATYRVEAAGLPTIIMRVHRLDYAAKESIQVELEWLEALARSTDLRLAAPIRARNGEYVQTIATPGLHEDRNVVCFSFVEGRAPRDSQDDTESMSGLMANLGRVSDSLTAPLVRLAASIYDKIAKGGHGPSQMTDADRELYRAIGKVAGTLRAHATQWAPAEPNIGKRIRWDWTATFGDGWNNYYGVHYWDMGSPLSRHDIEAIDAAAELMAKRLRALGTGPGRFGLIHSDLRPGNLLVTERPVTIAGGAHAGERADDLFHRMGVLDFDDCGMGWYMTDIAGIVGFQEYRGDLDELVRCIVEGYRERWDLSPVEEAEIPTFVLMRRIGLTQALMYHLTNAAPGSNEAAEITPDLLAFYAKGTAVQARRYVREFAGRPLPEGEG